MANSKKTFTFTLHVSNAERFMLLYGHRIGKAKEFKSRSQALNDLLAIVFSEYWDDPESRFQTV